MTLFRYGVEQVLREALLEIQAREREIQALRTILKLKRDQLRIDESVCSKCSQCSEHRDFIVCDNCERYAHKSEFTVVEVDADGYTNVYCSQCV